MAILFVFDHGNFIVLTFGISTCGYHGKFTFLKIIFYVHIASLCFFLFLLASTFFVSMASFREIHYVSHGKF